MSWNIAQIENTAAVPLDKREEVARWLVKNRADAFAVRAYEVYDDDFAEAAPAHVVLGLVFGNQHDPNTPAPDTLYFDSDNMEHMDYITYDDEGCRFLASVGTRGRITFGSLEGDNNGRFWGVEFASGHYRKLTATLQSIQWNAGTSISAT